MGPSASSSSWDLRVSCLLSSRRLALLSARSIIMAACERVGVFGLGGRFVLSQPEGNHDWLDRWRVVCLEPESVAAANGGCGGSDHGLAEGIIQSLYTVFCVFPQPSFLVAISVRSILIAAGCGFKEQPRLLFRWQPDRVVLIAISTYRITHVIR